MLKQVKYCFFLLAICTQVPAMSQINNDKSETLFKVYGSVNGLPSNLDPANIKTSSQWHALINLGVNLINYDINGRIFSMAAKSWKVSNDFKEFSFELNQNIKDSNGQILDSSDWKSTFEYLLSSNGTTHSFIKEYLDKSGIIAENQWSLKINLKKSYHSFIQRLATPEFILIPKTSMKDNKINFANTSGGYFLKTMDQQSGTVVFSANKNYVFYSKEQPSEVVLVKKSETNDTLISDLQSSKINFAISTIIPTDLKSSVISNAITNLSINSLQTKHNTTSFVSLFESTKLADPKVRKKINILLRSFIQKELKTTGVSPALQLYPPGYIGSLPNNEETDAWTQLKNEKLDNVVLPSKLSGLVTSVIHSYGLDGWLEKVFKEIGIDLKFDIISGNENFSEVKKNHDLYAIITGMNSKDPAGSLLVLIGTKSPVIEDPDEKMKKLLDLSVQENPELRSKHLHEISSSLIKDSRIIPLMHFGTLILTSKDLVFDGKLIFDDEIRFNFIRRKK